MNQEQFKTAIKKAKSGDIIIYYKGFSLATHRPYGYHKLGEKGSTMDFLATAAWKAMKKGTVRLVQKRLDQGLDGQGKPLPAIFEYWAVVR